jgi:hypothetical protein
MEKFLPCLKGHVVQVSSKVQVKFSQKGTKSHSKLKSENLKSILLKVRSLGVISDIHRVL